MSSSMQIFEGSWSSDDSDIGDLIHVDDGENFILILAMKKL